QAIDAAIDGYVAAAGMYITCRKRKVFRYRLLKLDIGVYGVHCHEVRRNRVDIWWRRGRSRGQSTEKSGRERGGSVRRWGKADRNKPLAAAVLYRSCVHIQKRRI